MPSAGREKEFNSVPVAPKGTVTATLRDPNIVIFGEQSGHGLTTTERTELFDACASTVAVVLSSSTWMLLGGYVVFPPLPPRPKRFCPKISTLVPVCPMDGVILCTAMGGARTHGTEELMPDADMISIVTAITLETLKLLGTENVMMVELLKEMEIGWPPRRTDGTRARSPHKGGKHPTSLTVVLLWPDRGVTNLTNRSVCVKETESKERK